MTFRQFMSICSNYLGLPKEKLFFEHRYCKGNYDSYKVGVVGEKADYQVVYSNMYDICQFYEKDNFVNCHNLLVGLDKLKEVLL